MGPWRYLEARYTSTSDNIIILHTKRPFCDDFNLTNIVAICYIGLNLLLTFSDKISTYFSYEGIMQCYALDVFRFLTDRKKDNAD
jgi:hypothetical protein